MRQDAIDAKEAAEKRAIELEAQRQLKLRNQRISKIINSKLPHKRVKGFKRSNSSKTGLEDFGDLDDIESLNWN